MNKKVILVTSSVFLFVLVTLGVVAWQTFLPKKQLKNVQELNKEFFNKPRSEEGKTKNSSCEQQYANLIKLYGQNFDDCKVEVKKAQNCDKTKNDSTLEKQQNVILIFDSSGSMAGKVDGKRKIDIAKEAATKFVSGLSGKKVNFGMIFYGHKGSNQIKDKKLSCTEIEEVFALGSTEVRSSLAIEKFSKLNPVGWTPIADSLAKAKDSLAGRLKDKNENLVILVSDGIETCEGKPAEKARELLNSDLNIKTNVIGFDISSMTEESQLKEIAQNGGGKYFSVKNEADFLKAFEENKNFMIGFNCYMEQDDVWLGNSLSTVFNKNECLHRLDMGERFEINQSIRLSNNGITEDCKEYLINKYQARYNEIKNQIEINYQENKGQTEKEKEELEKIRSNLDKDESVFK